MQHRARQRARHLVNSGKQKQGPVLLEFGVFSKPIFVVGFGFNFICVLSKWISDLDNQEQTQNMINQAVGQDLRGSNGQE